MGLVDYEIQLSGTRKETKVSHVHFLKLWMTQETLLIDTYLVSPELGPKVAACPEPGPLLLNEALSLDQKIQLVQMISDFATEISRSPERTYTIQYHLETAPGQLVRENPRSLPKRTGDTVRKEVKAILKMGY